MLFTSLFTVLPFGNEGYFRWPPKSSPLLPRGSGGGDFIWEGFFEGGCFNGGPPLEVEKLKRWQCSGWKSAVVIVSLRSSMFSGLGGRTPNRGRLGKFGGKKRKGGRERCRIQPWKKLLITFSVVTHSLSLIWVSNTLQFGSQWLWRGVRLTMTLFWLWP